MSDILCIYFSRTGKTKTAMEEIARELNAEMVEIHDGVNREGTLGWLRCGLDSMKKSLPPVNDLETRRPLESYRLVIVGTPTWAGRCSAPVRSFLKKKGKHIQNVAYLATRGTEDKDDDIFDQMDLYVRCDRVAEVSLRLNSVGYAFWREEFLRRIRDFLENAPKADDPFANF